MNVDTLTAAATPALTSLLDSDENQLFEQLGITVQSFGEDPSLAGEFAPAVTFDATLMGPLDGVRRLGERIFRRWEVEAHALVCGGGDDERADRKAIGDAFGLGGTAVAATMAGVLVTSVGLAPAVAAIIAAIIVKRFLQPGLEAFCQVWQERLDAAKA